MQTDSKLAIIIPAYKDVFLCEALDSLTRQTNKNFTVYIGDDASPYNLSSVVERYKNSFNLVYKKFESNLGGKDLVAQWTRCVDMSFDESWIWLFSDDDVLDENCVECFYKNINQYNEDELLHFNVNVIDEKGIKIGDTVFPEHLDAYTFALHKFKGRLKSYVVEYIFSRSLYNKVGGFQKYDLAWNADDATWVKMALEKGIRTIADARVNWRKSSVNISPNTKDAAIVNRKIQADLSYVKNTNKIFSRLFENIKLSIAMTTWFCVNLLKYKKVLTKSDISKYLKSCTHAMNKPFLTPLACLYFIYRKKRKLEK